MFNWLSNHVLAIHSVFEIVTTLLIAGAIWLLRIHHLKLEGIHRRILLRPSLETPFVIVAHDKLKDSPEHAFFKVLNIGNTPALDVQLVLIMGDEHDCISIGALAVNQELTLGSPIPWTAHWAATISYKNLSGELLTTLVDAVGASPSFQFLRGDEDF